MKNKACTTCNQCALESGNDLALRHIPGPRQRLIETKKERKGIVLSLCSIKIKSDLSFLVEFRGHTQTEIVLDEIDEEFSPKKKTLVENPNKSGTMEA